jgi:hypothetical protein
MVSELKTVAYKQHDKIYGLTWSVKFERIRSIEPLRSIEADFQGWDRFTWLVSRLSCVVTWR